MVIAEISHIAGWPKARKLKIPTTWKDLSPDKYIHVATLHMSENPSLNISKILGISPYIAAQLSEFQKYKLVECLDFIQDADTPLDHFIIKKLPRTRLYAPEKRLDNMSLQHWMTVDTYFNNAVASEFADKELNAFIGALYLVKGTTYAQRPNGDKRKLVNLHLNIKQAAKVAQDIKMAIVLNYIQVKSLLSIAYPYLFPKSTETTNTQDNTNLGTNWLQVFDSFVADYVHEMPAYQAMNCTDAFRIMNGKIKTAQQYDI